MGQSPACLVCKANAKAEEEPANNEHAHVDGASLKCRADHECNPTTDHDALAPDALKERLEDYGCDACILSKRDTS